MGAARDALIKSIYRGRDPFAGMPEGLYAVDKRGWNSQHPILSQAATRCNPIVIVEIGVWKGGSVITMAEAIKKAGIDGVVVAVDTWLGSWEHWFVDDYFRDLALDHGYPCLNRVFMNNIMAAGLTDYVLPIPLDSLNASHALWKFGVVPDVIHLDGCHDYEAVIADIGVWWHRLKRGGLFIGDDYNVGEGAGWQGVRKAFDEFFGKLGITQVENANGKCWITK